MGSTAPAPSTTDRTGMGSGNMPSGTAAPSSTATGMPLPANSDSMINERAVRADRN